jgi:hypothetical protein
MIARHLAWGCGGALALLAACSPGIPQPDAEEIAAARKAGIAFDVRIKLEITDRLDRGEDPVAIYLAYADHVPGWAKEISDGVKFEFSRTSLAPRNPAAGSDAWESSQMELFSYMVDAGKDPNELEAAEIRQEGDANVFRWMRPIVMGEACLACHGERLDPRIRLLLAQEYPLEGQIGGAYSVRKVLSVNGKPPPPYQPTPLPPRLPADERQPGDAPLVQPETVAPAQPERSPYDLPADEPPPDAPF